MTSGAREAWLNSPVRKRLRCKLQDEIDDDRIESRIDRLAYKVWKITHDVYMYRNIIFVTLFFER